MPFHAPDENDPERILSFGAAGTGKTFDLLCIAKFCQQTGSDAQFHVLDLDRSLRRMLNGERFGMLNAEKGGNVHGYYPHDWGELMNNLANIKRGIRPQDWLTIDLLSPTWNWAQEHFTYRIFHQDLGEFFMAARGAMKGKKLETFDGWKDWSVINGIYGGLQREIKFWPGHVFCTSEVASFDRGNADEKTKNLLGPYGVQPVGQKGTPHIFSTLLWKRQLQVGEFSATTVKDRERTVLEAAPIKNFALDYLKKCGGWVM